MADRGEGGAAQLYAELSSLKHERRAPRRLGTWILFSLTALALVAGAVALRPGSDETRLVRSAPPMPSTATAARTLPPEPPKAANPALTATGYIVSRDRYASIGAFVPGRIEAYMVEEGDRVRKGQILVRLDSREYAAAVKQAEATRAVAEANLALAESELARGRALNERAVLSGQELDVLENKARVALATRDSSQAGLARARLNLEYSQLRSPTNGVVLAKLKETGEIAVPGGFAGSGDLIRVANLEDLRVEVDINEADLRRVRLGEPARIAADAYPDRPYEAEVAKIYPQVDRRRGTVKVEVRILEPDSHLLPDMSARVDFLAGETE